MSFSTRLKNVQWVVKYNTICCSASSWGRHSPFPPIPETNFCQVMKNVSKIIVYACIFQSLNGSLSNLFYMHVIESFRWPYFTGMHRQLKFKNSFQHAGENCRSMHGFLGRRRRSNLRTLTRLFKTEETPHYQIPTIAIDDQSRNGCFPFISWRRTPTGTT